MVPDGLRKPVPRHVVVLAILLAVGIPAGATYLSRALRRAPAAEAPQAPTVFRYQRHLPIDTSGYSIVQATIPAWEPTATLEDLHKHWQGIGGRMTAEQINLLGKTTSLEERVKEAIKKVQLLNFQGKAEEAYNDLARLRDEITNDPKLEPAWLFTLIYYQGITALRRGENENCVNCLGASACILPISHSAIHQMPIGSRTAIKHFMEYLSAYPNDLEVRWLLNLAHMTLGQHPDRVAKEYLIQIDAIQGTKYSIGQFRNVSHLVGLQQDNMAGGAIMDDFDNDGLLDIVVTSSDLTQNMAFYRNTGDGKFKNLTQQFGLVGQLGGLNCVQTDYNNDGWLDIFIPRGAWQTHAIRPTLLRNDHGKRFVDVTEQAGLLKPCNSNSAQWADFDNDGWLDLFVCCEQQPNMLFRNRGDGTFVDVASAAGVALPAKTGGSGSISGYTGILGAATTMCKGGNWIDFDNDDYPDLFLNYGAGQARLFRNNRRGAFREVTKELGLDGPMGGFGCWAWDYDNDGWLDIWATSYDRTVEDVVLGIQGKPHSRKTNRLWRNLRGTRFENRTREAGLDGCYATMGCNFGDLDGDGWLDMYLGTGDPSLSTLVPNRLFRGLGGKRFAEISGSSGTAHLQKGHGVAMGDWDRNGSLDLFIELGGAIPGDRYHNVMFQNPGNTNSWVTLKFAGVKSNRPGIGARIKIVTAGKSPMTIHRVVCSGSSFGANPLEQTIGLGKAQKIDRLEVRWPTSRSTQVFRNLAVNRAVLVREFAPGVVTIPSRRVPSP